MYIHLTLYTHIPITFWAIIAWVGRLAAKESVSEFICQIWLSLQNLEGVNKATLADFIHSTHLDSIGLD